MEDPWGSPWTSDAPPKIDFPARPPSAHFAPDHSSQRVSPARTPVPSPWGDEDDAWGGWAEPDKDSSPRWGRSPGLKPLDSVSRLPSPAVSVSDVWGQLTTESARTRRGEVNGDSAISIGDDSRSREEAAAINTITNDMKDDDRNNWLEPEIETSTEHMGLSLDEEEGSPGSPEGAPQPALDHPDRPKALRQPSLKVQELVVMYDGMAKRSQSASPVDLSGRKVSGATSPVGDDTQKAELSEGVEEEEEFGIATTTDVRGQTGGTIDEGQRRKKTEHIFSNASTEAKEKSVLAEGSKEEPGQKPVDGQTALQPEGSEPGHQKTEDLDAGQGQPEQDQDRRRKFLDVLGSSTPDPEHPEFGGQPETADLEELASEGQSPELRPRGEPQDTKYSKVLVPEQHSSQQGPGENDQAKGVEEVELEQQYAKRDQRDQRDHSGQQPHSDQQQPDERLSDEGSEDPWSDFETASKNQDPEGGGTASIGRTVVAATHDEVTKEAAPDVAKQPPVPFSVNMSKLNDLFSTVDTSFPTPEPVPDVIIDDTFTSISERKTWYRISRFGSMRKHNLGDDDNYVRMSWGQTHVREQAIRIVRRWMEEDSIAGRVVLGRRSGAVGGHIFNWDTSAPAVEISELLNRRSHSRQESVASKATAPSPTAATFGWNSSPVPSPILTAQPPVSESWPSEISPSVESFNSESIKVASPAPPTKPSAREKRPSSMTPIQPFKPFPLQPVSRPVSISQPFMSPIMSPTSPLAQPPETAGSSEEDDDEDWGDMVSSPTAEASGSFPSLDAIVDGGPSLNGASTSGGGSSPAVVAPPSMDAFFESWSAPEPMSKGRPSLDVKPSERMVPSHSRSATVDLKSISHSSLKGHASENSMPIRAGSSFDEHDTSNAWGSGAESTSGAPPKSSVFPVHPITTIPPTSKPLEAVKNLPRKPRPLSLSLLHCQSPLSTVTTIEYDSQDDEIIANILRDLPDLTYMLR